MVSNFLKIFWNMQIKTYQIANLWEVIGCSLGSFIHPSIRDRPRGWSNFLVDFFDFLASYSMFESERWNVLYLADPNWVFSRWRRRFAHRATPPTLVCFSESLYSGKFHLYYWKMTKKNLVWSQSASLFCSVQSARASFRTDSRLLSKFGPGSSVATTAKMALKSAVVKEREIQTKLKRVYFPQQMS